MSQLIVQIYKLSRTALKTKARVVKVNHALLHIVLQVNQNKISVESTRKDCMTSSCCSWRRFPNCLQENNNDTLIHMTHRWWSWQKHMVILTVWTWIDTHQPPLYQIQINERCGNCKSRKLTYKFWTGTHTSLESNVTDSDGDMSIAMCENAEVLAQIHVGWKQIDRSRYKSACSTVLVCFNYSTSLSIGDFSSLRIWRKGRDCYEIDALSFKLRCDSKSSR